MSLKQIVHAKEEEIRLLRYEVGLFCIIDWRRS